MALLQFDDPCAYSHTWVFPSVQSQGGGSYCTHGLDATSSILFLVPMCTQSVVNTTEGGERQSTH